MTTTSTKRNIALDNKITGKESTNGNTSNGSSFDSGNATISGNSINDRENGNLSFCYPICWCDDERMGALFVPFRPRDLNEIHYDNKMKFWHDLIAKYCEFQGTAVICQHDLRVFFERKGRLPACLEDVLIDMQHKKKLRLRIEYEYDPGNTWTGWAVNSFVKRPLFWGWNSFKNAVGFIEQNAKDKIEFIHLEAIQNFTSELQNKVLKKNQGKLLHYDDLRKLLSASELNITDDCLELCLITLHAQRKIGFEYVVLFKQRRIHLIKIPLFKDGDITISETDRAIHKLEMAKNNVNQQLEKLEIEIKTNEEKLRQNLKEARRSMAKTFLRRKHVLEKKHEQLGRVVNNIDELLDSVVESQNQSDILDAYKIGSKALQKTLDTAGLKYDDVSEVVLDVRESLDAHREVQDTLSNTVQPEDVDEDELERELKEILGENTPKSIKPQNIIRIATPTTTDPNGNRNKVKDKHQKVDIAEEELLNMLENLEVETTTPTKLTNLNE